MRFSPNCLRIRNLLDIGYAKNDKAPPNAARCRFDYSLVGLLWADPIRTGCRPNQRHGRTKSGTRSQLHGAAVINGACGRHRSMVVQCRRPGYHVGSDERRPVRSGRLGYHEPRVLHCEPDYPRWLGCSGKLQIARQAAGPKPSMLFCTSRCARIPHQPAPPLRAKLSATKEDAVAFCKELYADPRLAPLRGVISIEAAPSLSMQSNKDYATDEQRTALDAYQPLHEECRNKLMAANPHLAKSWWCNPLFKRKMRYQRAEGRNGFPCADEALHCFA